MYPSQMRAISRTVVQGGGDPPVSLDALGGQLATVLTKLAEGHAALVHARHRVGESGTALAAVVDDEADPDVLDSISAYRGVWYTTTDATTTLAAIDEVIRAYMTSIGAPGADTAGIPSDDDPSPPSATTPPEHEAQPDPTTEPMPEFASPEWAIEVGTTLPTYVTSGNAFDDAGNELELDHAIRQSGPATTSPAIDQHLRNGVFQHHDPRGKIAVSEHVEAKLAWYMSQHGINHVNVVINNTPCRGMFNCRRAVAAILRSGASITVWSAQTGVTYELKGAQR